ncbi:hypothetical protein C361_00113 [Cryptococcus neoformans Tu259-1]|uniref:Luciferase domain-containing protein n=1 Tax=Cryptococcus neoformans Tu259-1 TaxID=1230072 RepID=A0A854QN61_CRYNE|nr:hypothetical protein C361_00113 [Cryptococcus neoformans var. grubii Tu259-1]
MSTIRRFLDSQSRAVVAAGAIMVAAAALWITSDYRDWIAFGTGGTPSNPMGYLKMRKFWLKRLFINDDLTDWKAVDLKRCPGLFPTDKNQKPSMPDPKREVLHHLASKLQSEHPDILNLAPSKTEGGTGDAIYAKEDLPTLNPKAKQVAYEIAHVHPADNSLHVHLSPRDAKKLIEKSWAERFPVHELGPPQWVMVYAPRNKEEIDLVEKIMRAAVGWVTGSTI